MGNGNRLPKIADRGSTGENGDEVTKVINKATKSYGERRKHFEKIHAIFK